MVRTSGLRATAEELARDGLQGGRITDALVQQVLSNLSVPLSTSRKRARPEHETSVAKMVFGLYVMGGSCGLTKHTKDYPEVTRLLAAFAQQERQNFPFTTIQVNISIQTPPHLDENNEGWSLITGLGDYSEGKLFLEDARGNSSLKLKNDVGKLKKGTVVRGFDVDIKGGWLEFDGNKLHATRAFRGNRLSIIYFVCSRWRVANPQTRMDLGRAGFKFLFSRQELVAPSQGAVLETESGGKHVKTAVRRAHALFKVNSNQKGGGGCALFAQELSKLRLAVRRLPHHLKVQISYLLDMAVSSENYQAKTPGTWRRFLVPVLGLLSESSTVAEKHFKTSMMPVRKAEREAKRLVEKLPGGMERDARAS